MMEPTICLKWVTERPYLGGSRQSPDFVLLDSPRYLRMELFTNNPPTCRITLVSRVTTFPYPPRYMPSIELLLKIGKSSFYESRLLQTSREQAIFDQCIKTEVICPSGKVDKWTVLCMFKGKDVTESLSLQVGNRRATLSSNVISLPANKCVQVSQEVPQNIEALSSDISGLLEDGILPDFELKCGGRTFQVHKSVLAARSEVWRAMFHNQMQEIQTRSCDIQDVEVHVLESLLKFLYSGKLDDLTEDTIPKLCEAADKYAVRSLMEACCYWMIRNLSEENCVNYLKIADLHSYQHLRYASVSFIVDNPTMIKTESWLAFSKEHPSIAIEVLQTLAESLCS